MKKETTQSSDSYEERRELAKHLYKDEELERELKYIDYMERMDKKITATNMLYNRVNLTGVVIVVLGSLIAMLLPEDILSNFPILSRFCDTIAIVIPSIDKMTAVSNFPQVTRLFLSISWFLTPFLLIVLYFAVPNVCLLNFMLMKKSKVLITFIYLILFPGLIYFFAVHLGGDPEYVEQGGFSNIEAHMSKSKFMLGVIVSLVILFGVPLMMQMILCWIKDMKKYYRNREI